MDCWKSINNDAIGTFPINKTLISFCQNWPKYNKEVKKEKCIFHLEEFSS